MSDRVVKVGVAGLGMAGGDILSSLAGNDDVAVVASGDPRASARTAFEVQFDGRAYAEIEALCEDKEVEAIWIATPTQLHAEHVKLAAEHGKHVVVEKPFAVTLSECEAMIDAASSNGVVLIAGGARSFEPDYVKMREVLTSGTLGRLLALSTSCYTPWIIRPRLPYEVDVTQGGGTVYNQAPHSIDVMRLLGGGKVRSLRGTTVGGMTGRPCPSYFSAYLEFEDGTPGTITYDGSGYVQGWEFVPWGESEARIGASVAGYAYRRQLKAGSADEAAAREGLRFGGFEGLHVRDPNAAWIPNDAGIVIATCEDGVVRESAQGLYIYDDEGQHEISVDRSGGARRNEVRELRAAIIDGVEPLHDGRWGQATLEVVLGLIESAAKRSEVFLDRQVGVTS